MKARAACLVCLIASGPALSAGQDAADPGRLFYSPAQRTQLETARLRKAVPGAAPGAAAPVRYDGVVVRSDGKVVRWVDGRPQLGTARIDGLKPGQIRAGNKVYEPYQVLHPDTPREPSP